MENTNHLLCDMIKNPAKIQQFENILIKVIMEHILLLNSWVIKKVVVDNTTVEDVVKVLTKVE